MKVRRLKSSWNVKKSITATKKPINWSCWFFPPLLAFSFIFVSLNYLLQFDQRITPRISLVKTKMTPKLQQALCHFISIYHQALLERDASTLLQLYAPTVKYYHLGEISKQIVFEEKEAYFKRWQYLEQTLLEMPEVFVTTNSTEFQVHYVFKFRVEKPFGSHRITPTGKGRQLWCLQETVNSFVILEENQQVFYRHDD